MKIIIFKIGDFFYKILFKSSKEVYRRKILKKFNLHETVTFWKNTFITGEGDIIIGKNTYIGQQTYISANPEGSKIVIGDDCAISHNIQIRTGTYNSEDFINGKRNIIFQNITIGNNVWIGANSFIAGGVIIGDNVIIAANSFVKTSFGGNCIIAGTPAKKIKDV
jgi:maltose O-acetyltransferase